MTLKPGGKGKSFSSIKGYKKPDWVFEESRGPSKPLIFIFGYAKSGKTFLAFGKSLTGENIFTISFDNMAGDNVSDPTSFDDSELIHNWSAIELPDGTPIYSSHPEDSWTQSAHDTYDFIQYLFDQIEEKHAGEIDWILLDGYDIFSEIVMMRARLKYDIPATKPIPEQHGAYWTERNRLLRYVTERCYRIAEKGVIVTTYTKNRDIIVDGVVQSTKEVPKWTDWMEKRSQLVLRVDMIRSTGKMGKKKVKFHCNIYSAKGGWNEHFPTGEDFNITGLENLEKFWKGEGVVVEGPKPLQSLKKEGDK